MPHSWSRAIAASVAAAATTWSATAYAATMSSTDRARVATLVYQSASAKQVDLRRGDAATKSLLARAESAERTAAATRAQLASAKNENEEARRQARALAQKLALQEDALAQAAEEYTKELAKRDEEYARERTILISTGERLLKSPKGGQVLDLYNTGGEGNWEQAKRLMADAQRIRRAVDARDTARMYLQAKSKGLETAADTLAKYEEVVRDDPGDVDDWRAIAFLRRELGRPEQALQAIDQAQKLAKTERERWALEMDRARAVAELKGPGEAAPLADQAVAIVRSALDGKHAKGDHSRLVESLALSAQLHLRSAAGKDEHPGFDKARAAAREAELHSAKSDSGHGLDAPHLLVEPRVILGEVSRLRDRDTATADRYYEAAIQQARLNVAKWPNSPWEKRRLASALRTRAAARLADGRVDGVDAHLAEAIAISEGSRRADAGSLFSAMDLAADYHNLARIYRLQRRFRDADKALKSGLKIAEEFQNSESLEAANKWWLMQEELGSIYAMSGRFNDAIGSFRKATDAVSRLTGRAQSTGRKDLLDYFESNLVVPRMLTQAASAHWQKGEVEVATSSLSKAVESFERQRSGGNSEAIPIGLVGALNNLAEIAAESGDSAKANQYWERSLAVATKAAAQAPTNMRLASLRARTQLQWGRTLAQSGDTAGAIRRISLARAEFEKMRLAQPNSVDVYAEYVEAMVWLAALGTQGVSLPAALAVPGEVKGLESPMFVSRRLVDIGGALQTDGRLPSAREVFQGAVARYEPMPYRRWSEEEVYITALNGLGFSYQNADEFDRAEPFFAKASAVAKAALARFPHIPEAKEKVALTSIAMADVALAKGQAGEAQRLYSEAQKIFEELRAGGLDPGWYDFDLEYLERKAGAADLQLDKASEALAHADASARIAAKESGLHFRRGLRDAHILAASALDKLGRKDEALARWGEAQKIGSELLARRVDGFTPWDLHAQSGVLLRLSEGAQQQGAIDRALALLAEAEALVERAGSALPASFAARKSAVARRRAELAAGKTSAAVEPDRTAGGDLAELRERTPSKEAPGGR